MQTAVWIQDEKRRGLSSAYTIFPCHSVFPHIYISFLPSLRRSPYFQLFFAILVLSYSFFSLRPSILYSNGSYDTIRQKFLAVMFHIYANTAMRLISLSAKSR